MRVATAWPRRIAEDVTRSWRYGGRRGRLGVAGLAVCGVLLCAAVADVAMAATAEVTAAPVLEGLPVPAGHLPAIKSAAASCPELTPPRLAAQMMEASKFNPDAKTADGGSGVAGLTTAQWQQWKPAPGASRTDVAANILALAHDDCNLAGEARAAGVPGGPWRLALAAFHAGLPAVIAVRGIPADAASYVSTVAAYASFYTQQPQFGGKGTPTPTPTAKPTPTPTAKPAPTAKPTPTPTASAAASPSPTPSTTPQTASEPKPLADGTYYIKNRLSSDVIDIPGFDTAKGTVLDQWPQKSQNDASNQQWQVQNLGGGIYEITSVLDDEAVDILRESQSPGTFVDEWPYWGGPNQQFRITRTSDGYYTIINVNSNEAVEVPGNSLAAGTSLDQNTYNGGSNQQWYFEPMP